METYDCIKKRKSSRNYSLETIDEAIIDDILNCGNIAPSAKNRKPWEFIKATKEQKAKIAEAMLNQDEIFTNEKDKYVSSVASSSKIVNSTAHIILIVRENDAYWKESDLISIGACLENMCLRATDLNLGSVILRDIMIVKKEILQIIDRQDVDLVCAIAIGQKE